jgi:hypothetical protein
MRNTTRLPTLEDIAAQLEAQNIELAETAQLAESIPNDLSIPESALQAFDELTDPPAFRGGELLCCGLRA